MNKRPRIVSLLPAATEIVHALGFGDALVGRSHECDFPPAMTRLPVVSAPRIDVSAPGAQIHADVMALVAEALSIYRIDPEMLAALAPDIILTQTQCAVCAVSLDDVTRALAEIGMPGVRVVAQEPRELADIWTGIRAIAAALRVPARGLALIADMQGDIAMLEANARVHAANGAPPRVAALEWLSPMMSGGNWMPDLIRMAGGEPLLAESGRHSPWIAMDELAAAAPDVIVVVPCGFELERTRAEYATFRKANPAFAALDAVRAGRVALVDGHAYFNRPGPRLVDSLQILCEILHPGAFQPSLMGPAWSWT